jgi:hypothetical protein
MAKSNPIGVVGWTQMLNQCITGFFMEFLQTLGLDAELAIRRIGLHPLSKARGYLKNNFTHADG